MMTGSPFENKGVQEIVSGISETALYLWQRGWAERNAGNISVNISHLATPRFLSAFESQPVIQFEATYPALSGQLFILTGAGTRMRDVAKNPEENLCFVMINGSGTGYHQFCQKSGIKSQEPTSELPTHMAIQEMLVRNRPEFKAVVHTHAHELVSLTQIPQFTTKKTLNRLLWSMHPESVIFVPRGIGFVPFTLPGTGKIAKATVKALEKHDILVWEKHGVIAVGKNAAEAFDTIDILTQSARIFFTCRNAGFEPEGLTGKQLAEIKRKFKI